MSISTVRPMLGLIMEQQKSKQTHHCAPPNDGSLGVSSDGNPGPFLESFLQNYMNVVHEWALGLHSGLPSAHRFLCNEEGKNSIN
jgi:hypothetical protein